MWLHSYNEHWPGGGLGTIRGLQNHGTSLEAAKLFVSALRKEKSNPGTRIQLKRLKQLFGLKYVITCFLFNRNAWSLAEPLWLSVPCREAPQPKSRRVLKCPAVTGTHQLLRGSNIDRCLRSRFHKTQLSPYMKTAFTPLCNTDTSMGQDFSNQTNLL